MSTSFSPTADALRVEIKPSIYFYAALFGVALITIAAIFYAQLSWQLRFLFIAFIGVYTGYCWRAQKRQCGMLHWDLAWIWIDENDARYVWQLRHSTVWPGLIALQFYDAERKRRVAFTLLADSFVFADDARRLRVRLHHFPVFDVAEKAD